MAQDSKRRQLFYLVNQVTQHQNLLRELKIGLAEIFAAETGQPLRVVGLAYGVDTDGLGIEIENMPNLKALDRRIDEIKGKRDQCQRKSQKIEFTGADGSQHLHWRPSRRWQRYNQGLQRIYRLRGEKTKTYLYTLSNQLCRGYVTIGVGN